MSGNPDRIAIALRYDTDQDPAPVVTATGRGHVAERVIALAEAHGVPIRKDPALVAMLAEAELGEAIPVEAYRAVARILAVILRAEAERPGSMSWPSRTAASGRHCSTERRIGSGLPTLVGATTEAAAAVTGRRPASVHRRGRSGHRIVPAMSDLDPSSVDPLAGVADGSEAMGTGLDRYSAEDELASTVAAVAAARVRLERGGSVDLAALREQVAQALGRFTNSAPAETLRIALLDEATRLVTAATIGRDSAEQELRQLDLGSRAARAYRGGNSS